MPHLQSASRAQPHPAAPNHTQPHRQGEVGLGRARPGEVGQLYAYSLHKLIVSAPRAAERYQVSVSRSRICCGNCFAYAV